MLGLVGHVAAKVAANNISAMLLPRLLFQELLRPQTSATDQGERRHCQLRYAQVTVALLQILRGLSIQGVNTAQE